MSDRAGEMSDSLSTLEARLHELELHDIAREACGPLGILPVFAAGAGTLAARRRVTRALLGCGAPRWMVAGLFGVGLAYLERWTAPPARVANPARRRRRVLP